MNADPGTPVAPDASEAVNRDYAEVEDAIGSYFDAIAEIGRRTRAGEPLPMPMPW